MGHYTAIGPAYSKVSIDVDGWRDRLVGTFDLSNNVASNGQNGNGSIRSLSGSTSKLRWKSNDH